MKKIFLPGLIAGAIMLVISMLTSMLFTAVFPVVGAEYNNLNLFRPFQDPLMLLFFVHPFILMIILSWVWDKVKGIVKYPSDIKKAWHFGGIIWLIATFPGMLITYASFQFSLIMVVSWTVASLIGLIVGSLIFTKLNR